MKLIKTVLISLILIIHSACILDTTKDEGFKYPLAVGNHWEYNRQWDLLFYNASDTLTGNITYTDTLTYYATTSCEITGTLDTNEYSGLYAMATSETSSINGATVTSTIYYKNHSDGLYLYGYANGAGTLSIPKTTAKTGICFKGRYYESIEELSKYVQENTPTYSFQTDSIYFENPILKSIQYPLEIGTQWTFREPDNPWRMDRTVIAEEELSIDAGRFNCFVLKFLYDLDDDNVWDDDVWMIDYISKEGLIKREIHILYLLHTTVDYPTGTGKLFNALDIFTLRDYDLK